MPLRPATIFRVIVILALAAHAFFMYSIARVMRDEFGLTTTTFIIAALFSLAMMIPLFWAAWLPDVPEAFVQWRAGRRWSRYKCPKCNYDITRIDNKNCPECFAELVEPAGYELSIGTLRRFAIMSLIAWIIGIAVGETMITLDERAFRRETLLQMRNIQAELPYSRARLWPNGSTTLVYSPADGFSATD